MKTSLFKTINKVTSYILKSLPGGRFGGTVALLTGASQLNAAATQQLNNLVCFVRFAGEEAAQFQRTPESYTALFNGEGEADNSVYNYFRTASYGQLLWTSEFCPAMDGGIKSYQTQMPRSFYQPYDANTNPDGYQDATSAAAREQALVKEIAAWLTDNLPGGTNVDCNGDGIVDNLTIVFSGGSNLSSKYMLWPHRSVLTLPVSIAGAKVTGYLLVFDSANGYSSLKGIALNTGVLCHEMSHSLGTYDLYHVNDKLNPVGVWDLMSDNQHVAQQMTAYTKYRYCKWIDEIPEAKTNGTYTLAPVGASSQFLEMHPELPVAYKIRPLGSQEYFVAEYRKKEGFDASLPASGLIVYRINPNVSGGNVGYNGTTRLDEQYILRPGGTTTADGNIREAAVSADNAYNAIGNVAGQDASVKSFGVPFYSNGRTAPFSVTNVTACGETISFDLRYDEGVLLASDSVFALAPVAEAAATFSLASDKPWHITGMPSWLKATPAEGDAGEFVVTISATEANSTSDVREATLVLSQTEGDNPLQMTLMVTQQKSESTLVLFDDFENTANPNGWTIYSTGDRGWRWQAATNYYKAYEGNYSATVYSAWDDIHQEEILTSPVFANATELTFQSRSTASGSTPHDPQYYIVEVTNDAGLTWTSLYNLCKDQDRTLSGKWNEVTIDLSLYTAPQMQVRFRCYDTNDLGLSYFWSIDNVAIKAGGSPSTGIRQLHDATSPFGDCNPSVLSSATDTSAPAYNLAGQRVSNTYKGIVVTKRGAVLVSGK